MPNRPDAAWHWVTVEAARRKSLLFAMLGVVAVMVLGYAAISGSQGQTGQVASGSPDPANPTTPETARTQITGTDATNTESVETEADSIVGQSISEPSQTTVRLVGLDSVGTPVCTGSGVLISAEGVILTTADAIESSDACPIETIGVAIADEEGHPPVMSNTASLIEIDQDLGVALIGIDGWADPSETDPLPDFAFAPVGDSDTVRIADRLRIVTYPASGGDPATSGSGVVNGFKLDEASGDRSLILTESSDPTGASGVAFDGEGKVVGIPAPVEADESEPSAIGIRPINLAGLLLADYLVDDADEASAPTTTGPENATSLPSIMDDVEITNPRFSSGVNANAPIDELISASVGLDQLCLFADWSGIPDGTRWDGVWYIDGEAITEFSTIDDRWKFGKDGRNFWMCAIDPGTGLKTGVYEVALFLNEEFAFSEAIVLAQAEASVYPVTWRNATGVDLCGFAVNPRTDSRQVGANELTSGEVIAAGGELTLQIAEGIVIAEAYTCDGELIANDLAGERIDGPATFTIDS